MYCSKCGAENDEQAVFCVKCGQRLNAGSEAKRNPEKKSSGKIYMVLTALVLVATLVIVSVFNLWPWSKETEKAQ